MIEVDFLFDNQLIASVESLIRSAKNQLVLISPFIDLDERIVDALREKKNRHDFELKVLFGKNDENYEKSLKRDSMEFFKSFPNVEIRYSSRLHAKFYRNDFEFIMTSLNLYDYSLANNIEVGIKASYASKGLFGKAEDAIGTLINTGADKVEGEIFGIDKSVNPIEKFETIYGLSDVLYKTEPRKTEKSGIQGLLGSKKLDGYDVIIDKLSTGISTQLNKGMSTKFNLGGNTNSTLERKCKSASQICKSLGISVKDLNFKMQSKGLINGDKITELGLSKGLMLKSYMGNDYIAYPEDLQELKEL